MEPPDPALAAPTDRGDPTTGTDRATLNPSDLAERADFDDLDELRRRLAAFLRRIHGARAAEIRALRALSGGASRQTCAFDATLELSDGSRCEVASFSAATAVQARASCRGTWNAGSSRPCSAGAFPSRGSTRWATTRSVQRSS